MIFPSGFKAAATSAGLKGNNSLDLGLLVADQARNATALFTQNRLLGAHIPVCRTHLAASGGLVRALIVNSGNANCATGAQGIADAEHIAAQTAALLNCPREQILPLSTGVIGAPLPTAAIEASLPTLFANVSEDGFEDFARAIMTTDTKPKLHAATGVLAVAKGAGMVHPDMATMLAFLLCEDVGRDPRHLLQEINRQSFDRLSIDGDTSPNDTVILWGQASDQTSPHRTQLIEAARSVTRAIARDGEGATRLVTIQVHGAATEEDAIKVARCISTSLLTKTAVTGRDPNWGRILSAAGRAQVAFDPDRARVWIGDSTVFDQGIPQIDAEDAAATHLRDSEECVLGVDLGEGSANTEAWTCDLTSDYVRINADYRS